MMQTLFWLVVGHALADFALQSDALARNKNRHIERPSRSMPPWPYWLVAHALIHGGAVAWVTGSIFLGLVEVLLHALIDFAKCEGYSGPHEDQAAHVICKIGYAAFVASGGVL